MKGRILLLAILISTVSGCARGPAETQPPMGPEWTVKTVSAECGTVEGGDLDVRAVGNSIVATATMQTSTPCYDATAEVTIDGSDIQVEIGTKSQGGVCIECIGKVVGRVTISDLKPGNYGVDVRTPDKAAITVIMIE